MAKYYCKHSHTTSTEWLVSAYNSNNITYTFIYDILLLTEQSKEKDFIIGFSMSFLGDEEII